jgi:sterol desaturase/sphingolipid hydroxylase (fatty acid hydroxylase superfamily)
VIIAYLEQFRLWLHGTFIGQVPLLEQSFIRILELFAGPFTGNGRFHWVQLIESLVLAAVVYAAGRQVKPADGWRGFLRYCFPKELYKHPSAIVDYQLNVMNACFGYVFNLAWRVNTVFITGLLAAGLTRIFGPPPHPLEWTTPWLIGLALLAFISQDLGNYVLHYVSHRIPSLWALHKLHHSAEVLTPFTANRVHPLEASLIAANRAIFISVILAPVVYFFAAPPAPIEIFGIAVSVMISGALGDVLMHTHVWLSWGRTVNHVLFAPAMHQIHHSQAPKHWDRNFGAMFSIWDWMFGTIYIPAEPEIITYGVYGEPRQPYPNGLVGWVRPIWEMVPMRERIVHISARLLGSWVQHLALRMDLVRLPSQSSGSGDQV